MSENWKEFFLREFDLFALSPLDVLVCIVIGVMCVPLIRFSGPRVLGRDYRTRVVQYSYDGTGVSNIIYRIISPVVITYLLLILISLGSLALNRQWILAIRWMPIVVYWTIQAVLVSVRNGELYPVWTVLIQALVSLAVAVYFDWVVVCNLPISGITVFDQSNIGWQVLTGLFLAASQLVLFGIVRGVSRYNRRLQRSYYQRIGSDGVEKSPLDPMTERKLFRYLREYDDLLPEKYHSDILLKAFFYTVMLVEDSNRPAWFRNIERIGFRIGIAKTTGIMQVKSEKALSDQESVALSIPIIEDIWNSFLTGGVRQSNQCFSPTISFSSQWYRYRYKELRDVAICKCGLLYGRYCGSASVDIRMSFCATLYFFDCIDRFFPPEYIVVKSNLFRSLAEIIPGRELCFHNDALSIMPELIPAMDFKTVISTTVPVALEEIKNKLEIIGCLGTVISISGRSEVAGCVITAFIEDDRIEKLRTKIPDWEIDIIKVGNGDC